MTYVAEDTGGPVPRVFALLYHGPVDRGPPSTEACMTPISLLASFKAKRSMAPGTLLDVATKARITK
jgi:hypothetical protein